MVKLSVPLEDEISEALDELVEDSNHTTRGGYAAALIRQQAAEEGIISEDGEILVDTDEDTDPYDPHEYDGILGSEEIRHIVSTEQTPAINPDHLGLEFPRMQKAKTLMLAAAHRYRYPSSAASDETVEEIIRDVIGAGANNDNLSTYTPRVKREIEGEFPTNTSAVEMYETASGETYEAWRTTMEDLLEVEELQPAVKTLLDRANKLEAALEADDREDDAERVRELVEEAEERRNDADF